MKKNENKTKNKKINITDLTCCFLKAPVISDVKDYLQTLITDREVFNTLNSDWKIDIRGGSRIRNHIAYSSKATELNAAQKRRHYKYVMSIKNLINNAYYLSTKDNVKPDEKPKIEKYHYFETFVRIGDKEYKVILNTEQYKGESTIKPQTVHLYDILEIK